MFYFRVFLHIDTRDETLSQTFCFIIGYIPYYISYIFNLGTRTADFSPSDDLEPTESFLASVFEEGSFVGVTLIDTSRGILMLGQFEDDVYRTNLRTLFAHRQISLG